MTKRWFGNSLICLGVCLIFAAGGLTGYNTYDNNRAEIAAEKSHAAVLGMITEHQQLVELNDLPAIPDYQLKPDMDMPTIELDGDKYIGIISIPGQDISLPVLAQYTEAGLKTAPCCYDGSIYTNDCIICAHNYRSHFGRLRLVQVGDKIKFTDIDGNEFIYEVTEIETIAGTDIDGAKSGVWDLTLFTCTIDAQDRIVVRCERLYEGGISA